MRKLKNSFIICILCFFLPLTIKCQVFNPWGKGEFKGRIAWSSDGNYCDEDDWGASPVALAIFAEFGVKDKLVHFDYNNIMPITDKEWERQHAISVLGAATRYGYSKDIFVDCQKDLKAAVNSIAKAINASSADNPLYFILAGPMEVPLLGIQKADPEKLKFITCISHNAWNDGYMDYISRKQTTDKKVEFNKRDIISMGINWIQITDQNQFLRTSPRNTTSYIEPEWRPWFWMRDSKDPNLRFIFERLMHYKRADCSDAGMAYFLMTGDEEGDIDKLKSLLENKIVPKPLQSRTIIRMEAENFEKFQNFDVFRERGISQHLSIMYSGETEGYISTKFKEIYSPLNSDYDVEFRIHSESGSEAEFCLYVNGEMTAERWKASGTGTWHTETIRDIPVAYGDEISIKVISKIPGIIKLDYIQLTDRIQKNPFTRRIADPLDDPNALPGQIIIAGDRPGYLKYNGIPGPAYLCGPDNPETFAYDDFGHYNTRKDSGQEEMIKVMDEAGVNAFHFIIWKMQKTNIKGEGNDLHNPFIDNDPSKELDQKVLDKWDKWLDLLKEAGITVHLEFYDDATDVEMIGWKLDDAGNLHPDEHRFITGIVNKFKHHKNIIWGIEESLNKPPRERVTHFKKIADIIAETDNHNHPIHLSFVIPNDPEGDDPENPATPDDFKDHPNARLVSWLHIHKHDENIEAQYEEYLKYYLRDFRNFIVMTNETFRHPNRGSDFSRKYVWACAMTGMHKLIPSHRPNITRDLIHLQEDGYVASFMEKTDFHTMWHRNDLAAGSAKWVLANPGNSYILYTYDYQDNMGLIGMFQGWYDLLWLDTETGETVWQRNILAKWGENTWKKPPTIGNEIALYVRKRY